MTTTLTGHPLPEHIEPGTPAWLAKWSASQVAAAVGLSKWDTPRSLYDQKVGIVPRQETTAVQGRGHEFEPMIRNWFAQMHPTWTVEDGTGVTWQHNLRDWQIVNLDGAILTDQSEFELLEVKTAQDLHEWEDQVPLYYEVQAQWAMDVTGARRTHLAACGPFELFNRRPKVFVLDYNPGAAAALREKVLELDMQILLGIQPEADHTRDCDRLAVRYAHPTITDDPGLEIPDELAVPYLEAFAASAAVEAAKVAAGSALLEYLGPAKKATYRGATIATRVNGKGDKPPTLRATNGLADKAHNIINNEKDSAA